MISQLRSIGLATLACAWLSTAAGASGVFVQWATPTENGVIRDCSFATNTVPGSFTEADLAAGVFEGLASSDGSAQSAIATVAYSGIETLIFTNTGAAAVTLGGIHPFDITLDATFSHTIDALGVGSWATQLIGSVFLDVQGDPLRQAQIAYSSAENWNNGLQATAFDITPTELGGGVVTVITGTTGALSVTLSLGSITLDPGETMTLSVLYQPIAIAIGSGFTATTNLSSARLRMVLPEGVTLSNDACTSLGWVTVPEPVEGLLLSAAALGLALRRRAHAPGAE
jgi:hypothetical protein